MLDDAPLPDGTCVARKPLGSPLRKYLERLDHRHRNLRIENASMQVGEESWLPPARHRHHVGVPDQDDDFESRVNSLET